MANMILAVHEVRGALVVDSRLIAERLGIQHKNVLANIDRYLADLQRFGQVAFETETVTNSVGAVNSIKFAYLNEAQSTLLMALSRNTPGVVACKVALVTAFEKAKETIKTVIPAQNDRIRELELANENLRMQKEILDRQDTMLILHGAPTVLALMGRSDQVVETDRPTIEVIDEKHNIRFKGQTVKQIAEHLSNNYGMKIKNGAEVRKRLERAGRSDLIAQTPRSILADYIPDENLAETYRILGAEDRQRLIGE